MEKYRVVLCYSTAIDVDVWANSEEEACAIAEMLVDTSAGDRYDRDLLSGLQLMEVEASLQSTSSIC